MINKKGALIIISSILFLECGVPKEEHDRLKKENEQLKIDIEECRFGAEKLLDEAKTYYDDGDYQNSLNQISILLEKHPSSIEVNEAKKLADSIRLIEEKASRERKLNEQRKIAEATKKLRNKFDEFSGITRYYDKSSPNYLSANGFFGYILKFKDGQVAMRLRIQYAAKDWLFLESIHIKVDDKQFVLRENGWREFEKDNSGGRIYEWIDSDVHGEEYEILKSVAEGKDVKIRFYGKIYTKDKVITEKQKQGIRNILGAYTALGGLDPEYLNNSR